MATKELQSEKPNEPRLFSADQVLEEIGQGTVVGIVPESTSGEVKSIKEEAFDEKLITSVPENSLVLIEGFDEFDGFVKVRDGFVRVIDLDNPRVIGEPGQKIDEMGRVETLKKLKWPIPLYHGTKRAFSSNVFYNDKFHIENISTFTTDPHYAGGYTGERGTGLIFLMPAEEVNAVKSVGGVKCYLNEDFVDGEGNISLDSAFEYDNSEELRRYLESLDIQDYKVSKDGKSIILPILYGYMDFDTGGVSQDYYFSKARTGERIKDIPDVFGDTLGPVLVYGKYMGKDLEFIIPNRRRVEVPDL